MSTLEINFLKPKVTTGLEVHPKGLQSHTSGAKKTYVNILHKDTGMEHCPTTTPSCKIEQSTS